MTLDDRLDLADLCARYSHLVDGRDFDGFASVFTEDVVFDMTAFGLPRYESLAALQEGFAVLEHPFAHHTTNTVVEADGDGARIRSKCLVVFDGGRVGSSVYVDDAVRTPAGWRIRSRVVVRDGAAR